MRIEWVRIRAFGPFTDKKLDIAPGMTMIIGDNESGKTSWHAAIYAALCGMRRGAGRRTEDRAFIERHRPWEGDSWSVQARLLLADGRQIEITQELDGRVDCRAVDVGLGMRDVSDEIMFEGSPDASTWLGLDRRTFLATACVNQAEVSFVTSSADALQEHLQRAAATAGADETAARALKLIDEFRAEHVGLDRAGAVKPLRRAVLREAEAKLRLEDAERAHEKYLEQLEAANRLDVEAALARRRLNSVSAAVSIRDAASARSKFEQARELMAKLGGDQIDLEAVQAAANRVSSAIGAWKSAPEPGHLAGPSATELESELARLPAAPIGDLAPSPVVVEAETAWRAALNAFEAQSSAAPAEPPASPTRMSAMELRELARDVSIDVPEVDPALELAHSELEQRLGRLPERRVSVPLLVIAGLVAAASVAIGIYTTPIVLIVGLAVGAGLVAFGVRNSLRDPRTPLLANLRENEALLGQSRLAAEAAQKTINAARERAVTAGLAGDEGHLLALAAAVEDAAASRERRRQWEATRRELESAARSAAETLRATLIDRGIADAEDLESAVSKYRRTCAERARIAEQAARRVQLERERQTRSHAEAEAEAALNRHQAAKRDLIQVARELGLPHADPITILADLTRWQDANHEQLVNGQRQSHVRGELDALLAGQTLDDLVKIADDAQLRAEAAVQRLPRDEIDTLAVGSDLDDDFAQARDTVQSASVAAAAARGELKQLAGASEKVSAAEEERDAARAELERVRRLGATLERTHEFLEKAQERVHRDIAPVLERTLRAWLPQITAGRYTDASVDPEVLTVQVKDPAGKFRDAEVLSQGTLEQIYLLLRMALVEHLTKLGEVTPLIFDDVTVQTDSRRTAAILELLHDISEKRQVIVFSQEEDVCRWAEGKLGRDGDAVIKLAQLAGDLQAPLPG
jgi:exonuclease SbcC